MSLEDAIKSNTAAIEKLTAAMGGHLGKVGLQSAVTPPIARQAQKAAQQGAGSVGYDDVKKVALEVLKKGKPALEAVWKTLGVAKGPELKPEQYAAALAALKAALK